MSEAHEGSVEDNDWSRPVAPGLLSCNDLEILDVYQSDPRGRIATQHGSPKDGEMRRYERRGWVQVAATGEYGTTWKVTPAGLEVIDATYNAFDALDAEYERQREEGDGE